MRKKKIERHRRGKEGRGRLFRFTCQERSTETGNDENERGRLKKSIAHCQGSQKAEDRRTGGGEPGLKA